MMKTMWILLLAAAFTLLVFYEYTHVSLRHFKADAYVSEKWLKRNLCDSNKVFGDTLLVLNFNYPFYWNKQILHDLYDDVFGKVVACGPASENSTIQPEIVYSDERIWHFRYRCLTKAIQQYPGYKGYMYSNDDIIINWWNLMNLNRRKVWQSASVDFSQAAFETRIRRPWQWWETDMGLKACREYYQELKILGQIDTDFYGKAFSNYMANGRGKPRCAKGWIDLFYVPARFALTYVKLSDIAYKHQLFLEIAGNNILRSLDRVNNFEFLNGTYLPDLDIYDRKAKSFWSVYNMNLTFIHPIKLNSKSESDKVLTHALVRNWIIGYKNLLLKSCNF